MSKHKNESASMYYQNKCKKLEEKIERLNVVNSQLDMDNKLLKNLVEKYSESSKELNEKYNALVAKLKTISDELNTYKERYVNIIKEAKIVAHRYKAEMDSLRVTLRK